jgi:hypothetical protein
MNMKACFRSGVVLLASLLSLSGVANASCATMTAFIDSLNAGQRAIEFPDPASCESDFKPALAKAVAGYVRSHQQADVEQLVAMIRNGYHKAERKTAFGELAAAVQKELAATGFNLPQTGDKYTLLDNLSQYAKASAPQAPAAKPLVKTTASVKAIAASSASGERRQPFAAWHISLVAAAVALAAGCALAGLILGAHLLTRRARSFVQQLDRLLQGLATASADFKTALSSCEIKLDRAETAQQTFSEQLQTWSDRFPPGATILSPEHLDGLSAEIRQLRNQVGQSDNGHDPAAPPPSPVDSMALEREVLGESWKKFRQNEQVSVYLDKAAKDECWKQIGDPLLMRLPKLVPDDLKPTFEAVLAPAREYDDFLVKISLIPKIVNGELPRLASDAQELARTREFAQFLAMSHDSTFLGDRLNFRLNNWVMDNFLAFADLYLQRYQQLQMENRQDVLEEGVSIVKRVLRVAALEPIDVKLGETPFDSTRHIGRSTANDARFFDGVIVGVVRNGFIEGNTQIIRQPEVVVNRTR